MVGEGPVEIIDLEKNRDAIDALPTTHTKSTTSERSDRALIAFTILTGARDGAIASFKLKHFDIDEGLIDQDSETSRRNLRNRSSPPSSRWATTSGPWWSIGYSTCGGTTFGGWTIHSSPRLRSR
jgi:hypothetical protein